MDTQETLRVTIAFIDPSFNQDEHEAEALKLKSYLNNLEELELLRVGRSTPKDGNEKGLGFIPGWLVAQLKVENGKKLFSILEKRLSGRVIELEIEGNGKKLRVKASSQEELKIIIAEAERFIQG